MVYKVMPRRYRRKMLELLTLSGVKIRMERWVNYSFAFSFALGFFIALLQMNYFFFLWIITFIAFFALFHGYLILAVDRRARFVEEILPDALQLMAANVRAGYIPSKALLLSARREFGPLAEAIKKAGKEILTGKSIQEGLQEIPKYVKSEDLKRAINLIIEGIKGGGSIVALLEENAIDIRRRQTIKKEIKANIMMYTIFITIAGCFGAPILYALSGYLITTLSKFGSTTTLPETLATGVPLIHLGVDISPQFLLEFSILAILITTFFGGIIIGLIATGRERAGIKYVPIFVSLALLIFFGANLLINSIFAGFLP